MISSKEVKGNDMGSRCEMSAEMSLMLSPCLLLSCLESVGPQVSLLAVGFRLGEKLPSHSTSREFGDPS